MLDGPGLRTPSETQHLPAVRPAEFEVAQTDEACAVTIKSFITVRNPLNKITISTDRKLCVKKALIADERCVN
jgi:hypothetical protein